MSARVLAGQCVRQLDATKPALDRVLMEQADIPQVYLQFLGCRCWQYGDAILHSFSIADQDPAVIEIHILDA